MMKFWGFTGAFGLGGAILPVMLTTASRYFNSPDNQSLLSYQQEKVLGKATLILWPSSIIGLAEAPGNESMISIYSLMGNVLLYGYVGGNPVTRTDPSGLFEIPSPGFIIKAIPVVVRTAPAVWAYTQTAWNNVIAPYANRAILWAQTSPWFGPIGSGAWGYVVPEGAGLLSPFPPGFWVDFAENAMELWSDWQEHKESLGDPSQQVPNAGRPTPNVGGNCPQK